jgi:hypothetical protein
VSTERDDDGSPLFNRAFVDVPLPATLASREAEVDDGAGWPSRLDVCTLFLGGMNGQNHFRHVGTGGDELANLSDVIYGNRCCIRAHERRCARRKKCSDAQNQYGLPGWRGFALTLLDQLQFLPQLDHTAGWQNAAEIYVGINHAIAADY